jgi:predicted DNA-binding transcriptional regulator YafY
MKKLDRIYKVHKTLEIFPSVTMKYLQMTCDCSIATVYRTIEFMRKDLKAPIENCHGDRYKYSDKSYKLPPLTDQAVDLMQEESK